MKNALIFYSFLFLIILFQVVGCAIRNYDYTNHSKVNHIVGKCFKIKKDSFIYEAQRCPSKLHSFFGSISSCLTVQAMGEWCLPGSEEEFYSNTDFWYKEMERCGQKSDKKIIGVLKKDTEFTPNAMSLYPLGETGSFWAITAVVENGKYKNQIITLPSYTWWSILGPVWFSPTTPYLGDPKPVSEYIEYCEK